MDFGISGKSAIVCGASRGLGKASATALAEEGVNVFIAARTEATLLDAAEDILNAAGGRILAEVEAEREAEQRGRGLIRRLFRRGQ